jgi:hypothetical protein
MPNSENTVVEVSMQFGENSFGLKLAGQNEDLQNKIIMNLVRAIKTEGQSIEQLKEGYQWMNQEVAATAEPEIKTDKAPEPKEPMIHNDQSNKPEVKYLEYGVKEVNGQKLYQLYYICDECDHRDKCYVPKGKVYGSCHKCGNRMRVRNASDLGFYKDEFNNFYHAGKFKRTMKDLEEDKKFKEDENKYGKFYGAAATNSLFMLSCMQPLSNIIG